MGLGPEKRRHNRKIGLHEYYQLCEEVDAEPWFCLPGTLHEEEMAKFMEYIGAPADVGLGKLRAKLGHPKPWTETLRKIHVEYGNEAWNGAGYSQGGYNGPDYWEGLMSTGKKSPYCKKNVIFHAGGHALSGGFSTQLAGYTPSADRVAIAPYMIHHYKKQDEQRNTTTDKLFRWSFGYCFNTLYNGMKSQGQFVKDTGVELSIYEVNYHATGGDGSLAQRRKFIASIGGGVNMANVMLMMLKDYGIRSQCLFNFNQRSFGHSGDLKKLKGSVPLWGTCLVKKKGQERVRPLWLALETINRVMGKDLMETTQTGAKPMLSTDGLGRSGKESMEFPTRHHYAFQDGKRNAIVLVNLHTTDPQPVQIKFPGRPAAGKARACLLTDDTITADNEMDSGEDAPVKMKDQQIDAFASGQGFVVPPFSMLTISWESE